MAKGRKLYATASGCDDIISISVNESHNSSMAMAVIECVNTGRNIGDDMEIYLGYTDNYSKVFKGYVKQIEKNVPANTYKLSCYDVMTRAVDYFVVPTNPENKFRRHNIDAEDLVGDVLALAGLTNYGYTPTNFKLAVSEGVDAEVFLISAYDYCKSIADLLSWHLYADRNGKVWFVNRKPFVMDGNSGQPGDIADTIAGSINDSQILDISLTKDERDLRNRVVVHGANGMFAEAKSSTSYDPITGTSYQILPNGYYKTVALVWTILDSSSTAQKACSYNLQLLNRLGVKASVSVVGDPSLSARTVINVSDSYLGISDMPFYVYALEHNWGREGFITNMELRK